jgi:hypothetical protein
LTQATQQLAMDREVEVVVHPQRVQRVEVQAQMVSLL